MGGLNRGENKLGTFKRQLLSQTKQLHFKIVTSRCGNAVNDHGGEDDVVLRQGRLLLEVEHVLLLAAGEARQQVDGAHLGTGGGTTGVTERPHAGVVKHLVLQARLERTLERVRVNKSALQLHVLSAPGAPWSRRARR